MTLASLALFPGLAARLSCTEWKEDEEDTSDVQQWEDNWDDDDVAEDDFTKQLRAELEKMA